MKLFLGVSLTMIAFAANSILNRLALAAGVIDPASFATIRIGSGVVFLCALLLFQGKIDKVKKLPDFKAVFGLVAYMLGFSFAYVTLDAGIGALLLFGGVQITMFTGALLKGEKPGLLQWIGALIAFGGLVYLLLPGEINIDIKGAGLMIIAAVGWGLYSLRGKLVSDPITSTVVNFLWSLPIAIVLMLFVSKIQITNQGLIFAVISGGITSGLGYALWYKILPQLNISIAAVSQLTVPIIAMAGGLLFLGEKLTITFIIASVFVLGGVALSVYGSNKLTARK